ncbi:lipopolysaccharide biosynthesis protein [Aromatoleum sp.]|uniref:lipopolysaccharide biosynthesis protein n=1 Tax=Aromatoleum sp. TaxID=2307007 RepID=UPI002FC94FD8
MSIRKNIGLNFVGNAWNGALIVLTTPWYISMLGMEGYGLVAFWQLLLYIFLIFDFGLGASLLKEFAAYRGGGRPPGAYRTLLGTVERICLAIALLVGVAILFAAPWIASSWLRLEVLPADDAELAVRFMALSVAGQIAGSMYANGLTGLQNHGAMNVLQMLGHGLRYLGGALILYFTGDIAIFFAFQGGASLTMACVTRGVLLRGIGEAPGQRAERGADVGPVLRRYAFGMFITALLGMLLANTDRILLSKLVATEDLGRYSLAFAGAGFLQMLVFAFYRSYFPLFSHLKASGDVAGLRSAYYQACRLAGLFIVPAAAIGWTFSSELIVVWVGSPDTLASEIFQLLILGSACAGLMWLPAAYQQASGWTSLHSGLMAAALALGAPSAFLAIRSVGAVGGTAMMLVHGAIEITFGLWLMNRVLFPGETMRWYRQVVLVPLVTALPLLLVSKQLMPEDLARWGLASWIAVTCLVLLPCLVATYTILPKKTALRATETR